MMSRGHSSRIILRRALKAAGIVAGYRHKCRRSGCGHVEAATDADDPPVPEGRMQLWVAAQARPIRFHDLRHTTRQPAHDARARTWQRSSASCGTAIPASRRRSTAHLAPGYLRGARSTASRSIRRADVAGPASDAPERARQTRKFGFVCYPLLPAVGGDVSPPSDGRGRFPNGCRRLALERDTGFEPATFSLGS